MAISYSMVVDCCTMLVIRRALRRPALLSFHLRQPWCHRDATHSVEKTTAAASFCCSPPSKDPSSKQVHLDVSCAHVAISSPAPSPDSKHQAPLLKLLETYHALSLPPWARQVLAPLG